MGQKVKGNMKLHFDIFTLSSYASANKLPGVMNTMCGFKEDKVKTFKFINGKKKLNLIKRYQSWKNLHQIQSPD